VRSPPWFACWLTFIATKPTGPVSTSSRLESHQACAVFRSRDFLEKAGQIPPVARDGRVELDARASVFADSPLAWPGAHAGLSTFLVIRILPLLVTRLPDLKYISSERFLLNWKKVRSGLTRARDGSAVVASVFSFARAHGKLAIGARQQRLSSRFQGRFISIAGAFLPDAGSCQSSFRNPHAGRTANTTTMRGHWSRKTGAAWVDGEKKETAAGWIPASWRI